MGKELAVIFGGNNKLTAKGPFPELLVKFRKALASSSELIIIGYSFHDKHINHCIAQWSQGLPNKITVIDYNKLPLLSDVDLAVFRSIRKENLREELIGAEAGIEKYCKAILENKEFLS